VVRHIDCHLCGECITHCPEKNTLSFNRKKIRWIPSLLIIVLISAGLVISAYTEIPTINQQWGTAEQLQRSENFLQENLSQIKCFGSSSSFSTRMHEINGVVGVSCFAGKHSARIFFDPKITSAKSIKEKIFEPSIRIFSFPNAINQNIGIIQLGINHFFDPGDADLLAIRFEESKGVYAFSTSFGEPIMTTIYFDRKLVSVKEIMSLINKREYQLKQNNHASSQNTNFETTAPNKEEVSEAVPIIDLLYRAMDIALNDKESQKKENIKTLTLNFQQSINKDNFNWIPHLMSHLSGDKGVINFKATCQGGKPLLIIVYVDAKTDANTILKTLNLPVLNIFMDNGETVSLKNPFYFKPIDIL
jgi:ferredoxin